MTQEQITGVAIRDLDGKVWSLPAPNRHYNVIHMIYTETKQQVPRNWAQGFVTESGRFLTRRQARMVAQKTGQFTGEVRGTLTSEDLW